MSMKPLFSVALVTVGLSALVLAHVRITARLVAGVALAVGGVILILVG